MIRYLDDLLDAIDIGSLGFEQFVDVLVALFVLFHYISKERDREN